MSEQQNAELINDELLRLLSWYVECQDKNGRSVTEEELKAFGRWYDYTCVEHTFIRLMLRKELCVKMEGDEPWFWLSESGKSKIKVVDVTEHMQHERSPKRRKSKS